MFGTAPLSVAAEVLLGRMRNPEAELGPNQVPYLRAANVSDGSISLDDVKVMHFSPAEQARYRLAPHDVLLTEASGSRAQVGQAAIWNGSGGDLMFQNTLIRLRARKHVDARFLGWWARFAYTSGLSAAAAQGLAIWHLSAERLRRLPFPLIGLDEQQRIADFLDDQVARFDRAVALRQDQVRLLVERHLAWTEDRLVSRVQDATTRPLAWLCDAARPIQYGIVLPGPNVDDGVPIIKGGDVAADRLRPEALQRTSPDIDRQYRRSRVQEGDLVIAIRGSYGELAKVPASLNGANLTQDSARIAPIKADLDWLMAVLQTPTLQSQMHARATGAMVKGLNIFELRRLPVPTPELAQQVLLGAEVRNERERVDSLRGALNQSLDLLAERKQALITAAVTGEFDVSTARGVA